MQEKRNPSVLLIVFSAGLNPWLEIERRGQLKLIRNNSESIEHHVWISGNPNFALDNKHRLLIGLGKLRMYHYPTAGRFFRLFRKLIVIFLKWFPTRRVVGAVFMNPDSRQTVSLAGQRVEQNLPTSIFVQGCRTLRALEWALENSDFDYLVRITSTCLVNEPALVHFIESLPRERVYAGQASDVLGPSHPFMSGAAYILSRDVVAGIVAHQHKYHFDVYEDVALGRLVTEFDLADWIPMNLLHLPTLSSAELLPLDELKNAPVIRCKAGLITLSAEPVLEIFESVANRLGWNQSEIEPIC